MKSAKHILSLFFFALLPFAGQAREPAVFDNYIVHHNAFTADLLDPAVAQAYGIQRSHNRAVLNISVQDKASKKSLVADIKGNAVTLNQQLRKMDLREIKEENAIYYLADFPVNNEEILDFVLTIKPQGARAAYELKFRQQFFTK